MGQMSKALYDKLYVGTVYEKEKTLACHSETSRFSSISAASFPARHMNMIPKVNTLLVRVGSREYVECENFIFAKCPRVIRRKQTLDTNHLKDRYVDESSLISFSEYKKLSDIEALKKLYIGSVCERKPLSTWYGHVYMDRRRVLVKLDNSHFIKLPKSCILPFARAKVLGRMDVLDCDGEDRYIDRETLVPFLDYQKEAFYSGITVECPTPHQLKFVKKVTNISSRPF